MRSAKKRKQRREMRPSYDFSKGVRGKYTARMAQGTNIVVLEADVASAFKTSKAGERGLAIAAQVETLANDARLSLANERR